MMVVVVHRVFAGKQQSRRKKERKGGEMKRDTSVDVIGTT